MYCIVGTFIVLDFVTGLIKCVKNKDYNSTKMREGLFHKMGSVLSIVLAVLIDYAQGYVDLGITIPIAAGVCVYIILMEIGSIIENIGEINPEILPETLRGLFGQLHKGGNITGENSK